MTWEELEAADPFDLLTMPFGFSSQFPPTHVNASLTIGMAAYGNFQTTLFALRAVLASVRGDFELILVDDASPDETGKLFELVATVHHNTKVFRFTQNAEYSGSLNTILSHARGTHILFVSNDIFITPAYVSQLLEVANVRPDAGIIRGCSNFVDNGLITHNIRDCGELDNFEALFSFAASRSENYHLHCLDDNFLTGDAFLVTRNLLEKIGYLDPDFFGYFADHDLGIRARGHGFRPQLALGAFAWHQHGANIEYLKPAEKEQKIRSRWARVNENWARFKQKYGLPPSLPYQGMRRIPWDGLASVAENGDLPVPPPTDQKMFLVPVKDDSREWRRYRATQLAKRAQVYTNASRVTDAIRLCRKAIALDSENVDAMIALGSALVYQGRLSEGMKEFRRAVRLSPTAVKAHSNLLLCMNYSDRCTQQAIFRESQKWSASHGLPALGNDFGHGSSRRARVRIAYLSPDFRKHSVSFFFTPLLKHHDRNSFEVYCLSDVLCPDAVTERLMALSDGWRDISRLDTAEAERVVREIKPDILVDLAGHTGQSIRLPLFSRRLAPVQVTWLGYPNTTGLGTMDYRLTDSLADPDDAHDSIYYSERLYRLPGGFLCYEPPENASDVAPPPLLHNGYITFGSFNMLPKITDSAIEAWSSLLQQVPNSRIILKNHYFRDGTAARHIFRRFQRNGITGERIELLPADVDPLTHLNRYGQIDIALDTFPYNGTTTTCEALWMGVPVITMCGGRHASRVGASILTRVGLADCISNTVDGYVSAALRLSRDSLELENMRYSLRGQMQRSPLCDGSGFAKAVETFYCDVLQKYSQSQ